MGTKQNNAGQREQAMKTLKLALSWYHKVIKDYPEDDVVPHARYGVDLTLKALGRKK